MASLDKEGRWRVSVVWQERRIKTSGVSIVESAWMLYSYSIHSS